LPDVDCGLAWRSSSIELPLEAARGRIISELISPYPPGIPLFFPGEKLDGDRLLWLKEQQKNWPDQIPDKVRVVNS